MRRPSVRIAAVGVLVAGNLGAALWHLPDGLRALDARAEMLEALPPADRELAGALTADVDRAFLHEARRLLPAHATYAVVTGPNVEVSTPVTLAAVGPFTGYWLLPRAQVPPAEADWILSYGGVLDPLGLRYERIVEVSPGLAIAEVDR